MTSILQWWVGLAHRYGLGQQMSQMSGVLGVFLWWLMTVSCALATDAGDDNTRLLSPHQDGLAYTPIHDHYFNRAWRWRTCPEIIDAICVVKPMVWQWQRLVSGEYNHSLTYYPHGAQGVVQPFDKTVRSGPMSAHMSSILQPLKNTAIFDHHGVKFMFNGVHELGQSAYYRVGEQELSQPLSGSWAIRSYYPYPQDVMSAVMLEEPFQFRSFEAESPPVPEGDGESLAARAPRFASGDLAHSYAAMIDYRISQQSAGELSYDYRAIFYLSEDLRIRRSRVVAFMAGATSGIKPQCGSKIHWSLCLLQPMNLVGLTDDQVVIEAPQPALYPYGVYHEVADFNHLEAVFKAGKVYFFYQDQFKHAAHGGGYVVYAYSPLVDRKLGQNQPVAFWAQNHDGRQLYDVFVKVEDFHRSTWSQGRGSRCGYKGYFYTKGDPQDIVAYFKNTGSCCQKNHHQGACSVGSVE